MCHYRQEFQEQIWCCWAQPVNGQIVKGMISAVLQYMNKIEGHPKYLKESFVTVIKIGIAKSSLYLFMEGKKPTFF